jgi:hypothetical protein
MENTNDMMRSRADDARDEDAVFAGWQETGSGETFALYTITAASSPSRGSTVSDRTLAKLHLHVPDVPPYEGTRIGHEASGNCGGCPVETRCIGPYHSRTGCSAFPVDEEEDDDNEG